MHETHIIFLVVFVGTLSVAFAVGRRDERIAATAMTIAAVLSPAVQGYHLGKLDLGILAVDVGLLAVLMALAFTSDRYWPLFTAAFHLVGTMTHALAGLLGPLHPDTYADAIALWAYPVQLSLLVGVLVEAPYRRPSPS